MQPYRNRARRVAALVAIVGALALAACNSRTATWNAPGSQSAGGGKNKVTATVSTPANGAADVPASAEIAYKTDGATKATVELTDAAGTAVPGFPRADGSSWVPQQALKYATRYTAKVTATGSDGKTTVTATSTFTTMAEPGSTSHMISQALGDGLSYGIGAPIVLTFTKPIPQDKRADVQRRLFVQSTPAQEGAWNWFSATEVHYRPRDYWQTGTKISLRALFRGVPLGNGRYGDDDLTVDASIVDHAMKIDIDDKTKTLTVTQDGNVIKTMPASLGKASTPSSSGNMVIMTRNTQEIFDSSTNGVGPGQPGYYRETIYYPLRLTWDGQYIHSAPWSVGQQGQDDVSHGCTNISPDNAKWLYEQVHVGDPVTVRNTGSPLQWADGWTDWDRSFEDYVKGSAIPYTPASGTTGATPSPTSS